MSTKISGFRLSLIKGYSDTSGFMDIPPNRLEFWRKKRSLSRAKLGALLNCHQQTVEKLENRKMQLTGTWLERLAKALDVAVSDILESNGNGIPEDFQFVPVIKWGDIGREMGIGLGTGETVAMVSDRTNLRASRVVGNAMNRVASDGTMIVYDLDDTDLVDKGRYLIRVNGETAFRQYRNTAGPARFDAESSEQYDTIYPSDHVPVDVVARALHGVRDL